MKPESEFKAEVKDADREMISRRDMIRQTAFTAMLLALPWKKAHALLLAPPKPPVIPFITSKIGEGIVGPYGEVRIFTVGGEILPIYVASADGLAVMDLSVRTPFVRYGTGTEAITLTTAGVQIGTAKPTPWSTDTVQKLIAMLSKDRRRAKSVLMLRSALHSTFPLAAAKSKSKPKEGKKKSGAAVAKGSRGFGTGVLNCTTRTITDTVTRTIVETVEVIKTAEKQYQECYDKAITRDPCKSLGFGAGACAATICAVTTFVDMVVGFIEVVTTITEDVTRQVVSCVTPLKLDWPNPWLIHDGGLKAAVPQPAATFTSKDIEGALKLIKDIGGFLGPFGLCLANGNWSLAQLTTPLDFGAGPVTIPYGVKVCIDAVCATQLSIDGMTGELAASWGAALAALAALSAEFAAAVSSLGIVAAPAVVALIAAVPPAVINAAAIILAFIILALIYGTAIAGQLFYHRHFTDSFADNVVCIEHPTFALAMIKIATLTAAPAELVPPIVTG